MKEVHPFGRWRPGLEWGEKLSEVIAANRAGRAVIAVFLTLQSAHRWELSLPGPAAKTWLWLLQDCALWQGDNVLCHLTGLLRSSERREATGETRVASGRLLSSQTYRSEGRKRP